MRGTQLARQWTIIQLLESRKRGMTALEIAKEVVEDIRTIYRDLETLQAAGFPLVTNREGRNVYWGMFNGSKSEPKIPFTPSELMTLHMSGELLRVLEGTVFHENILTILRKIKASLPPQMLQYLDYVAKHMGAGFSPKTNYESFRETINVASEAATNRKRLEIRYRAVSTGRTTLRKLDPYQIWAMNGVIYLIGHCHVRNAVRTFVLERIKNIRLLSESFEYPEEFDLADYLKSAFRVMTGDPVQIKVRFAREVAHVLKERIWHPSQEIREQRSGDAVVTLVVPINYEVISWILGFGSRAEVLEPPDFRKRIRDELLSAAKAYQGKASAGKKELLEEEIVPLVT